MNFLIEFVCFCATRNPPQAPQLCQFIGCCPRIHLAALPDLETIGNISTIGVLSDRKNSLRREFSQRSVFNDFIFKIYSLFFWAGGRGLSITFSIFVQYLTFVEVVWMVIE